MAFRRSEPPPQTATARPARPSGMAVRVFTPDYVLGGFIEPPGQAFLGWLNNVNQRAIVLNHAQAMGLSPDSRVQAFSPAEAALPKSRLVALDLMDDTGRRSIQLAQRRVPAAIYAAGFIIRAHLHPTGDMPATNLFNVMAADFFAVSDAEIRVAGPGRDFGPPQAQVLLINQHWVDFYHPL
ncbi:MAG: hypothetical protein ACOYZ7_13510 [Chloroflexota bacterium]